MDINRTQIMLTIAFLVSVSGLVMSIFYPEITFSDDIMVASLFMTALPIIDAKLSFERLIRSVYFKFIVLGLVVILYSLYGNFSGYSDLRNNMFIAGSITAITPLIVYIYFLHPVYSFQSKWLIAFPMILVGVVFKIMHWPGANIIIILSLLVIIVSSINNYFKRKNFTLLSTFLLLSLIVICICIGAYFLRYLPRDYFILGALFICSALLNILLNQEENTLPKP